MNLKSKRTNLMSTITYQFSGKLWKHSDQSGWHFVSLPIAVSKEIRQHLQWQEEGWGRMKAFACIEKIEWKTSIWFDKKANTYLLPIKADIRKKASLEIDDLITISISI